MPQAPTPDMQECIATCRECATTCLDTARYGLGRGGEYATAALITIELDCADLCFTSAGFMARGSDFYRQVCGVCADVCRRCAEACEQFPDDETMRRCAEICRRCEECCRRMAAMAA